MFVKSRRPSWQLMPTAFVLLSLMHITSAPRVCAQSRITVAVSPATASVQAGSGQQFTATVRNDRHNRGVRWMLSGKGCNGSTCGTLSAATAASGIPITYTAPPSVPNPATVTLTATSVSNTGKNASAQITVTGSPAAISINISPKRGGLAITQTLPISAAVLNDVGHAGVTWSVSGTGCSGTSCGAFINVTSTSATYVAPSTAGLYSIAGTSVADVTKSASIPIGVTDLPGVLTYHNNLSRDGTNTHEFALTTSNVNTSTFGKLFSCQADGAIYAQPLWIPNLQVAGAAHNVALVATQHESLYAFDADATPCLPPPMTRWVTGPAS